MYVNIMISQHFDKKKAAKLPPAKDKSESFSLGFVPDGDSEDESGSNAYSRQVSI